MAAVTMTPTRQPFASLDTPRLRALGKSRMNLQNKQNGAAITGKRKPLGDVIDAENIDPCLSASKRKRGSHDDEENMPSKTASNPSKTSRIALKTVEFSPAPRIPSTPLNPSQPSPTPKSVPSLKPAGRSPLSKSSYKPFARRSNISKPRPEPASRKSVHRPFSISTALSNGPPRKTKTSRAPAPTPKATPASWSFDIHVDSTEEEMTNLMQHSTGVLDISDDESKQETSSTGRGKENVPPSELGVNLSTSRQQESPIAATRKSVMMEESRAPLGELNASDYYGADCHAFSYAVIYDDEEDEENVPVLGKSTPALKPTSTQPTRSTKLSSVSSVSALLESTAPKSESESKTSEPSEAEIEIWESGSAAEEAAQAEA